MYCTQKPYLIQKAYNVVMSKVDLHQKLNTASEITLDVKGRKSGKDLPRPVWFAYEGSMLYLLPVQGSDTNWYENLLFEPMIKISINGVEILTRGQPITDSNSINEVVKKLKSKYGEGDVKKYYTKFDVAVEVPL
jgi:hypothetical protein